MKTKEMTQKRSAYYVVGSLALAAGAVVVVPKMIDYLSNKFYKAPTQTTDDDDWGPEIVKKETVAPVENVEDNNGEL